MNLKKQLHADLKTAMLNRDVPRKSALRMVLAAVQYAEVGKTEELSDEDTLTILRKEVRRREDALQMIQDAGRTELAEEEIAQLDDERGLNNNRIDEEITVIAATVIADVGATSPADLGKVMKNLMPQVKGKADGRMVNQVVRDLLTA